MQTFKIDIQRLLKNPEQDVFNIDDDKKMFLKKSQICIESCDTEEFWSNDAENSPLHCKNKLHFKTYSNRTQ